MRIKRGNYIPDWVRTTASLQNRTTVWRLVAEGHGVPEIHRKLQLDDEGLDRKTISQIIKEAIEEPAIPAEILKDLEPVTQQWIISKRPQLQEKVPLPEHPALTRPGASEDCSEAPGSTPPLKARLSRIVAEYRRKCESQHGKSPPPGTFPERFESSATLPTLKGQLLDFLYEGRRIEAQCLNEESQLPIAPAENWRRRTYALIGGQIAKYIADLWDESGFAPLTDSSLQGPSSAQRRELWLPIAARVIRLEKLSGCSSIDQGLVFKVFSLQQLHKRIPIYAKSAHIEVEPWDGW
jgi:hypothetical protein